MAAGGIALGGLGFGVFALGGLSIGILAALGGLAVGGYFAIGGLALAPHYIGGNGIDPEFLQLLERLFPGLRY